MRTAHTTMLDYAREFKRSQGTHPLGSKYPANYQSDENGFGC
jgi:hypothetical protein